MKYQSHLHLIDRITNHSIFYIPMFKTNFLKSTTIISTFLMILLFSFGCEKEIITPEYQHPTAQLSGYNQIVRPSTQCAPSEFASLRDGSTNFGSVEILNQGDELYLLFSLNNYKFLDEVRVFVGDKSQVPLNPDGNIETELFHFKEVIAGGTNRYTMILKLDVVPACLDIFVSAKVSTRNMFGQVTATNNTWMHGNAFLDGYTAQYCVVNCFSSGSTPSAN